MIIYKVEINEVEPDPPMIVSSYRAKRHTRFTEYYASKEGAESKRTQVYDGAKKLLGFLPGVEVIITEIEVKP